MKKQKLNRLHFQKSTVSKFSTIKISGGNWASTAQHCIITGIPDGCIVSENCNTNGCGPGSGGGSRTCESICGLVSC
jgi:hypothetical protein